MHKKLISLILVIALAYGIANSAMATPPSIDSGGPSATHIANVSGQSSISAPIVIAQSPDLAILDFYAPAAGGTSPAVLTIDGCNSTGVGCTGPLTWTRHYQSQASQQTCGNLINIPCHDGLERWTAIANSPVTATLTVALNISVVSAQVDTYGIHGLASVLAPYDPSYTGGPQQTQNINSAFGMATNIGVTVVTTNTDDLVLAAASSPFWISGDGFIECDHGFGSAWTVLVSDEHTQASVNPQYARLALEYKTFPSPIPGVSYGFKNQANSVLVTCVGTYAPFTFTLEAFTGSSAPSPPGSLPHVWVHE